MTRYTRDGREEELRFSNELWKWEENWRRQFHNNEWNFTQFFLYSIRFLWSVWIKTAREYRVIRNTEHTIRKIYLWKQRPRERSHDRIVNFPEKQKMIKTNWCDQRKQVRLWLENGKSAAQFQFNPAVYGRRTKLIVLRRNKSMWNIELNIMRNGMRAQMKWASAVSFVTPIVEYP